MGIIQIEPFSMEGPDSGAPCGASVDYWQKFLAPKMDMKIEVVGPFPLERVQTMLAKGEIDVISQLSKTGDRAKLFLYPETPLAEITPCLIVLKNSPIGEIRTNKDLFGTRIGYLQGAYLPPFLQNDAITLELIPFAHYRELNIKKLLAGRVDAVFDINIEAMLFFLAHNECRDKVRICAMPLDKVPVYSVFSDTERGKKLAAAFDSVNKDGIESGTYARMLKEYIK